MKKRQAAAFLTILALVQAFLFVGCNTTTTPSPTIGQITPSPDRSTPENTKTPTQVPTPTTTPEPLAALVNGEPIALEEYQQELMRYRQASEALVGTKLATDETMEEMIVLNDLIDLVLLAQGAREQSFQVDDRELEERVNQLASQIDLPSWLQTQGYSDARFRNALRRSIQAAWMRDQIIASVPAAGEQVHARQILLYNSEEANQVYANLQSGADFLRLAKLYDPAAAGDLGWFPRGYLTEASVEQAVFDLNPGEYSQVVETRLGYHILQVIERDPQRILDLDMRQELQSQAVQDWLDDRREVSEIEVLLP